MTTQAQPYGIVGKPAPSLEVNQWINLPEGKKNIDMDDLKGKVVYLYCFQSWCPGCHSSGFPTLKAVHEKFGKDDDVAFVVVQTTFEGAHVNTFEKAKETAAKYALTMPVGQSGGEGEKSALMMSYRTRGTPWTVIIDREGTVRFNEFHIPVDQAITLVQQLKAENKKVNKVESKSTGSGS